MHIAYLHDPAKIKERIKTIPLESVNFSVCWFNDSERIALVYIKKFQVINVLDPVKPIFDVAQELSNSNLIAPPKVVLEDRILILINKDNKLMFYDLERQKFITICEIKNVLSYCVVGEELIIGIAEDEYEPK